MKFNKIKLCLLILVCITSASFISKKVLVRAQTPSTITVCATGTAGQNGCNFIGGAGIQAAINSAPIGSSTQKTTIVIKGGNYVRSTFETFENRKYFLLVKDKNIILQGENNAKLDGAGSANMTAIAVINSSVEIRSLIISGFKKDVFTCTETSAVCSPGRGIESLNTNIILSSNNISSNQGFAVIIDNTQATVTKNFIAGNERGISIFGTSVTNIKNNFILRNRTDGLDFQNTNPAIRSEIFNNVLYGNNTAGGRNQLSLYRQSSVRITNNIITEGITGGIYQANGSEGFHVGLWNAQYNDVWGNAGGNYLGGMADQTGGSGNISQSPLFVNTSLNNFHLQTASPAINTGDPGILDTDGTRSDMGAYGGLAGNTPTTTATPVPTNTIRPPTPTATPIVPTNTLPPPTDTPSPFCPSANKGNLNCDPQGCVNNEDFNLFRNNYFGKVKPATIPQNQSTPDLYPDNSTIIDTADYEILRQNYNKCSL